MGSMMRSLVPHRSDVRNFAVMSAASWALGRLGVRAHGLMRHASWALPLGLAAANHIRNHRRAR